MPHFSPAVKSYSSKTSHQTSQKRKYHVVKENAPIPRMRLVGTSDELNGLCLKAPTATVYSKIENSIRI